MVAVEGAAGDQWCLERVCGSGSRGDAKAICLFSPGNTSQVFY